MYLNIDLKNIGLRQRIFGTYTLSNVGGFGYNSVLTPETSIG